MRRVILDIPDDQAMGLAQLCKRFCWEDAVRFANPHDGRRERDAILDGTLTLQRALREAGLRRADPDLEDSVPTSNRILRGGIGPPGGFHHDQHHESISLPLACQHAGRDRCYGAGRCNWAVQVAGGERRSDLRIDCGAPGGNARRTSLCYRDDIEDAAADSLAMIVDSLRDLLPV
jgi:hypothetical protein